MVEGRIGRFFREVGRVKAEDELDTTLQPEDQVDGRVERDESRPRLPVSRTYLRIGSCLRMAERGQRES